MKDPVAQAGMAVGLIAAVVIFVFFHDLGEAIIVELLLGAL